MPTQDTIEQIYKAFQENPNRLTYSTEKLQKQFEASQHQVRTARKLYRLNSKDFLVANAISLGTDESEDYTEGKTYIIPASELFEVLTGEVSVGKWITTEIGNEYIKASKNWGDITNEGVNQSYKEISEFNSEQWEVKQKWVKGKEGSQLMVRKEVEIDYKKEFEQFVLGYRPKSYNIKEYKDLGHKLAVVCMFDMHLGKIAFKHYTGNLDNLAIQKEYEDEFQKLLWFVKSQNPERILLPIGNDLFNVDNARLETFKGTKQDSTQDLHGMFSQGLDLMTLTIDALQKICPVDVVLIPGNHAPTVETYLAISLGAIYELNPNVKVDSRPLGRKYYPYGSNLIGLAHGELPLKKYAELLPYEAKEYFSEAKHIEVLVGDKHVEEMYKTPILDGDGITVRRLAALTKTDLWHYTQSYTLSKRRSYVLVYDKKNGIELQYTNLAD